MPSHPARHALFPGSFDPPTLGHVDLVERAARLFGRVTVGVATNAAKATLFDAEERLALVRAAVEPIAGVRVEPVAGLAVDACAQLGCDVLVRGVRGGVEYDYEARMAHTNRDLAPGVETVFLAPSPAVAHVSSTLVREIALLGGDASRFVPAAVARALAAKAAARGRRSP